MALTKEEKDELGNMLAEFKKGLGNIADKESVDNSFKAFQREIETKFDEKLEKMVSQETFDSLLESTKKIGSELDSLKHKGEEKPKSLKSIIVENKDMLNKLLTEKGKVSLSLSNKVISSNSITDNTQSVFDTRIGEIARGTEFLRNIIPSVTLSSNTHGAVSWFEETSITNNAGNVSEIRTDTPEKSDIAWGQKTLSPGRVFDWVRVGLDELKDFNQLNAAILRLVNKNMRLKENQQLLNGTGNNSQLRGINSYYAKEFDVTGIKIEKANLVDLIGKIKTQIDKDLYSVASPNYWIGNRIDVDKTRFAKDSTGRYLFESWALGQNVQIGNVSAIENALMTENTLLVGDFEMATYYKWDDLVVEIYRGETDMTQGTVTIQAYSRGNIRINETDKKAFVKVSDLSSTLNAIDSTSVVSE